MDNYAWSLQIRCCEVFLYIRFDRRKKKKDGDQDKQWNRIHQKKDGFESNYVLDFIEERKKNGGYDEQWNRIY